MLPEGKNGNVHNVKCLVSEKPLRIQNWQRFIQCLVVIAFSLAVSDAHAWIFPEHQEITALALQSLTADERKAINEIWASDAAKSPRLCKAVDERSQGKDCIDFSFLPAIAGDHSCSVADLRVVTMTAPWIEDVIEVSDRVRGELNQVSDGHEYIDVWKTSHLELELVDADYSARATNNNAHFARFRDSDELAQYLLSAVDPIEAPNAVGIYVGAHAAALRLAALAAATEDPAARLALGRRALWLEAFGLHFLQDVFSAGHIVGDWGGGAELKGTHDYYCEHGLDATTWEKETIGLKGDAFMRPKDARLAADSVYKSLSQVLGAFNGDARYTDAAVSWTRELSVPYELLDVCAATSMPFGKVPEPMLNITQEVVGETARPTLAKGDITPPRFRAELGPFLGLAGSAAGALNVGGYGSAPDGARPAPVLSLGLRFGYGPEGITTEASDGQMFLGLGYVLQGAQYDIFCSHCEDERPIDSPIPRVPSRTGVEFRLRMPYFLLPGDMLILAPLFAAIDVETLKYLGVKAAQGGLIPWQRVMLTSIGNFQFVVGREVALHMYGYLGGTTSLLFVTPAQELEVAEVRGLYFEFPIIQWQPGRNFQSDITLSEAARLGFLYEHVIEVNETQTDLSDVWGFYLEISFEARKYF